MLFIFCIVCLLFLVILKVMFSFVNILLVIIWLILLFFIRSKWFFSLVLMLLFWVCLCLWVLLLLRMKWMNCLNCWGVKGWVSSGFFYKWLYLLCSVVLMVLEIRLICFLFFCNFFSYFMFFLNIVKLGMFINI